MDSSGRTVLVVDDDGPNRSVLAILCESRGHAVLEAASGGDAVAVALARRPDLVLLDVGLPDLSGTEVCARLRDAGVQAPILMLSGHADPADVARAFDAGADGYVTKPYQVRDLVVRMELHMRAGAGLAAVAAVAGPTPASRPGDHPVTAGPRPARPH
jgi:two-component system KDP operon response regulator KdpE